MTTKFYAALSPTTLLFHNKHDIGLYLDKLKRDDIGL